MTERQNGVSRLSDVDLKSKAEFFGDENEVEIGTFEIYKPDGDVDRTLGLTEKIIDSAEETFTQREYIEKVIRFDATNKGVISQERIGRTVGKLSEMKEAQAETSKNSDRDEAEEYQGPRTSLERFWGSRVGKIVKRGVSGAAGLFITMTPVSTVLAESQNTASTGAKIQTKGTVPSETGLEGYEITTLAENLESVLPTPEVYPTEHYAERQRKIDGYKELLRANECQEINLEACANWLYSIDESNGFSDNAFRHPEKTVLRNYVTKEQVIEFGRTGKVDKKWNWKVVYHKDVKGKTTKEPALMYAANPENKVFSVKDIQKSIDWWEGKGAKDFLRVLNANDTWVVFQSQASDDKDTQQKKYGDGIFYVNYSVGNTDVFKSLLIKGFGVEPFGIKVDALWGDSKHVESGVVKQQLSYECCKYIFLKTGDKKIGVLIDSYLMGRDYYMMSFDPNYINGLVAEAKKWATPYGAATWAEIDEANAVAKTD